jgi:hypothetical protein
MGLPKRLTNPAPPQATAASSRLRRCTFRRLSRVEDDPKSGYAVSCLYPDHLTPLELGDLESSFDACASCTASHVFRPDED